MNYDIQSVLAQQGFPFYLDFGYIKYSIIFVDDFHDEKGQLLGLADTNNYTIKFNTSLSNKQFKEVFYHEVFHVLINVFGAIDPESENLLEITEEYLVTQMSRAWLMFLNLNYNAISIVNSL